MGTQWPNEYLQQYSIVCSFLANSHRKSPCHISNTINFQFLSLPSASESKIDVYMTLSTILCIYEYNFKNFCIKNDISFLCDFRGSCIMTSFAKKSSKFSNALTKRSRVVAKGPAPADGIHSLQFLQQQEALNSELAPQQCNMWDRKRCSQLTISYFPVIWQHFSFKASFNFFQHLRKSLHINTKQRQICYIRAAGLDRIFDYR